MEGPACSQDLEGILVPSLEPGVEGQVRGCLGADALQSKLVFQFPLTFKRCGTLPQFVCVCVCVAMPQRDLSLLTRD